MQTQVSSDSLEFVKRLYALSSNQQSQHLVTGIYGMGSSMQPLDDAKANQIAQAVAPFLPQQQAPNPFASNGFGTMGPPGLTTPSINGYQMGAPAFTPGPIPGAVGAGGSKDKPKYTEQDFRNFLAQGKVVCGQTFKSGERKDFYCCVEVKTPNSQLPMDKQICPTHGKTKKGSTGMNASGIASAFSSMSNMQFAPPVALPGQTSMQPQQQQMPWQSQQSQPNQMTTMPWQQTPLTQQQNLTPVASVTAPGLGFLNQQNNQQQSITAGMQPQMQQQSTTAGMQPQMQLQIPSLPGLSSQMQQQTPSAGMQQQTQFSPMFQQQVDNTVSVPQIQQPFNSLGGATQLPNSNPYSIQSNPSVGLTPPNMMQQPIQTISLSTPQQQQPMNLSIPGISGIPSVTVQNQPSIVSAMSNLSLQQQNSVPVQQQMPVPVQTQVQGEFFVRCMGTEEFYFNSDPTVSGLVFERTINGPVCIGRIATVVNNDGKQLPAEFKSMIGHSFTIDHDNWLKSKNIQKKDSTVTLRSEESIPEDFQADDS